MPAYNRGKLVIGQVHLAATSVDLQAMLVTTGYTFDADHNVVDDGSTNDPKSYEISVGNYARQSLASKSLFEDDTLEFVGLDATDLTFASLAAGATIGGVVLHRYSTSGGTTSDTGQELLCYSSLTATPTNGGKYWHHLAEHQSGQHLKNCLNLVVFCEDQR